jgi:hypothetical protein
MRRVLSDGSAFSSRQRQSAVHSPRSAMARAAFARRCQPGPSRLALEAPRGPRASARRTTRGARPVSERGSRTGAENPKREELRQEVRAGPRPGRRGPKSRLASGPCRCANQCWIGQAARVVRPEQGTNPGPTRSAAAGRLLSEETPPRRAQRDSSERSSDRGARLWRLDARTRPAARPARSAATRVRAKPPPSRGPIAVR